jgi:hypothetical protein
LSSRAKYITQAQIVSQLSYFFVRSVSRGNCAEIRLLRGSYSSHIKLHFSSCDVTFSLELCNHIELLCDAPPPPASWRWGWSSTQAWMPTYVSILRIPQMIWRYMSWRATGEHRKTRRKTCPIVTLSTTMLCDVTLENYYDPQSRWRWCKVLAYNLRQGNRYSDWGFCVFPQLFQANTPKHTKSISTLSIKTGKV